jgi:type IV pilus assembly protein PilN
MIKINLLGNDTARDPRGILFLVGVAASVVLLVGACFMVHGSYSGSIAEQTLEKETLEGRLAKLRETTEEVRTLEKKKTDLNEKLSVIARLKLSKRGPVRVLDDMNSSIPETAWITAVREKSNLMQIEGHALDNQTISLFMTALEASEYYLKVDLDESKQDTKKGVKLQTFRVKSAINYAGKLGAALDEQERERAAKGKKKRRG